MKYALILIIVSTAIPQPAPLTLPQVAALYQQIPDLRVFAMWAAEYKDKPSYIGWGLLDQVWAPFTSGISFDGISSGEVEVTTKFVVSDSKISALTRRVEFDLTTIYTAERIPLTGAGYYVPPAEPVVLVEPVVSIDPNVVILRIETIMDADPNNPDNVTLKGLLGLLKEER